MNRFSTVFVLCWAAVALAFSQQFLDAFTHAKQLAVACSFALLVPLAILGSRKIRFSLRLKLHYKLLIGLLLSCYASSVFLRWPGLFWIPTMEWLGAALFVYFFGLFFSTNSLSFQSFLSATEWVCGLVLIYWCAQLCGLEYLPSLQSSAFPVSFFGYQNFTAEFMGISLLVSAGKMAYFTKGSLFYWRGLVLIFAQTLCLVSLESRAALLATFSGLLTLLFLSNLAAKRFAELNLRCALPIAVFIGAISSVSAVRKSDPTFLQMPGKESSFRSLPDSKKQNIEIRFTRWKNTLELIKDHPFGIGPGNFEFGYLPYRKTLGVDLEANQSMVPKSPHNGYLEMLAENGVQTFLAFLLFSFVFSRDLLKIVVCAKSKSVDPSSLVAMSVLTFILIDACFNFPMETPFPFFSCTIMVSYLFGKVAFIPSTKETSIGNKTRFVEIFLCTALGLFAIVLGFSYWVQKNGSNKQKLFACLVMPDTWRNCIDVSYEALNLNQPEIALELAEKLIEKNPFIFSAHEIKIRSYLALNKTVLLCQSIRTYKSIVDDSDHRWDALNSQCQ